MSTEEDTELRDLVSQTLENNGVLPKIRAELRANVFLALEENNDSKTYLQNETLNNFLKTQNGPLILNLIKEFLEFYELDFTLSVFAPETKFGKDYSSLTKDKMVKQLNINENDINQDVPLLNSIINMYSSNKIKNILNNLMNTPATDDVTLSPDLNATYVKYKEGDVDKTPISSHIKNGDSPKSFSEEIASNKSSESSESSMKTTPRTEKNKEIEDPLSPFKRKEETVGNTSPVEGSKEIDLLTFTPIKPKETKQPHKADEITADKGKSTFSMLGDLPPLTTKNEFSSNSKTKIKKIDEIKAIMEQGLDIDNYEEDFQSSVSSKESKGVRETDGEDDIKNAPSVKSDQSHVSEKTESVVEEDFEDDMSDLLNSQASSDTALTVDETISRTSGIGDHMENV